jgi:hypothetical protein
MSFAARIVRNVRLADRHEVEIDGTLRDAEWRPNDVTVVDLSCDGFRIDAALDLATGCSITLGLPGVGPRSAIVVRATKTEYGCQFVDRLAPDELAAAMKAEPFVPLAMPRPRFNTPMLPHDQSSYSHSANRLSARLRLVSIVGVTATCWGLVIGARLLIG